MIVAVLKPAIEPHEAKFCPLCKEESLTGEYSELAIRHALEIMASEGKLVKALNDKGEVVWQEPRFFYAQYPEFKGKQE